MQRARAKGVVVAILLLLLASRSGAHEAHSAIDGASPETGEAEHPKPAGGALYETPTRWLDSGGNPVSLSEFAGEVVLLTPFYTSCYSHVCSVAVALLQQVEAALAARASAPVPTVLVSLDHAFDKPQQLARYKRGFEMGDHWHLLVGPEAQTRSFVADRLGYGYWKKGQRHIIHAFAIFVLDGQGRVADVIGYKANARDVVASIERVRESSVTGTPAAPPPGN